MARQTGTEDYKGAGASHFHIRPLLISLSCTLILLSALALCMAFGPVSEKTAELIVLVITIGCIFLAGLLSARPKASKGYLSGAVAGISYVLAAYCMSSLAFGSFSPGKDFLRLILLGIITGAVGGIIGVNTGHRKK